MGLPRLIIQISARATCGLDLRTMMAMADFGSTVRATCRIEWRFLSPKADGLNPRGFIDAIIRHVCAGITCLRELERTICATRYPRVAPLLEIIAANRTRERS